HAGEPGPAANEAIRAIWKATPRFVAGWEQIRWDGATILERLAERSRQLTDRNDGEWIDPGSGDWRKYLNFESNLDSRLKPPPACARFERPKRLWKTGGPSVLWKFGGMFA